MASMASGFPTVARIFLPSRLMPLSGSKWSPKRVGHLRLDAVAGVVNIILKRDYDGAETSLSYGIAPDGGGTEKRASQLFGTHWAAAMP